MYVFFYEECCQETYHVPWLSCLAPLAWSALGWEEEGGELCQFHFHFHFLAFTLLFSESLILPNSHTQPRSSTYVVSIN